MIGQRIKEIRKMTPEEMNLEDWHSDAMVIVLEDGSKLFPSADAEGNGPGVLFGIDKDKNAFTLS